MVKRRYIPFLVFTFVVTITTALALPIINVNVQKVGEGSTQVVSPFDNAIVNWVLDNNDPRFVTGVVVIADKDLATGSIVKVILVDNNNQILASGEVTLNNTVTAGNPLPQINFDQPTEIQNIDRVVIVSTGPQLQ